MSETITKYPHAATTVLPHVQKVLTKHDSAQQPAAPESQSHIPKMDRLLTEILASSLVSLGLFSPSKSTFSDLPLAKQPALFYERWLRTSIRYLQKQKWLSHTLTLNRKVNALDDVWAEWETEKSGWAPKPNQQAHIRLLEACLRALPTILSGKQPATDIIFPDSSMQLVEGIYQGNPFADYFNDVLGKTVSAYIQEKLCADKACKIRILEIGAGTGGTTAALLPLLQEFSGSITEYCYTDVSKSILNACKRTLPTSISPADYRAL